MQQVPNAEAGRGVVEVDSIKATECRKGKDDFMTSPGLRS